MKKSNKTFLIFLGVLVIVIGFLIYRNRAANVDITGVPCINPFLPTPEELHIHPRLAIVIDEKPVVISANIGLDPLGCEHVLHTHDDTGEIHVEPNIPRDYTLGDFFAVWGKPFSVHQVLDCVSTVEVDGTTAIQMTVDGNPNDEFEKLILKDKQKIVIECGPLGGRGI